MPAVASQPTFDLGAYLERCTALVNAELDKILPAARLKPKKLHEAMRYSLFAGGKRLRPAICLASAEACGGRMQNALPAACAVECIHTYSLIHDDLPAMDNDDFRRGKPTSHKVFGEGMAILAGDALLTLAFEVLCRTKVNSSGVSKLVSTLAQAAGSEMLIAGQAEDLESEGKKISVPQLRYIHERKTSALLAASARLGGLSVNCSAAKLEALSRFGYYAGLAFQVIDDILDVTQTTETLGKTAGKDVKAQKATYPSIVGLEKSRRIAKDLTRKAYAALDPLGKPALPLRQIAIYLLNRSH